MHMGRLRNGIVTDNIYRSGIPEGEWVGRAYTLPTSCSYSTADTVTFNFAQAMGIGYIKVTPPY
jgi:hypothetical protein